MKIEVNGKWQECKIPDYISQTIAKWRGYPNFSHIEVDNKQYLSIKKYFKEGFKVEIEKDSYIFGMPIKINNTN